MNTESQTDQDRITQLEASCAAMREAFETGRSRVYTNFAHVPEALRAADWIWISMTPALKSDAGKSLLDRLQAVEKERDRYKAALEKIRDRNARFEGMYDHAHEFASKALQTTKEQ